MPAENTSACLAWFAAELRRGHAEDSGAVQVGDESHLFVTMILAGRKRVASHAMCWRRGRMLGKVSTVGPASGLDKGLVSSLARALEERLVEARI